MVSPSVQATFALRLALAKVEVDIARVEAQRRFTDRQCRGVGSTFLSVVWCRLLSERRRLTDAIKQFNDGRQDNDDRRRV